MKKYQILILFLSLAVLASCSQKNKPEAFGRELPAAGITKVLPKVEVPSAFHTKALEVDYQKHLDSILETELVKVDALELYQNKEMVEPLLQMIKNSKKYFYMNVLAFNCDETTEPMMKLLEAKSKTGVDVRLILNKGLSVLSLSCLRRLKDSGVKVLKARTHSSYFLNDQQELMIGSESVVRFYFLADGFNDLDRDMMIYAKGPLATDSFKDFLSIWTEDGDQVTAATAALDLEHFRYMLNADYQNKKRGQALYQELKNNKTFKPERVCRFIAERPRLGVKDIQHLWKDLISINQDDIYFSGVKVEIKNGQLGETLKKKSNSGVAIHYLGNGYRSGNGELTMVLDEWIAGLQKSSFSFLAPALIKLKEWDKLRLALNNQELYDELQRDSKISVHGYFNFLHYKVWLFETPGFFVGSANLDENKFNVMDDAGIYCLDAKIHSELKAELLRDQKNSVLYQAKELK